MKLKSCTKKMEEREICDLHGVSLVSYTPPQIVKTGRECLVKMKKQKKNGFW